jgi:hypothetical protein
MEPFLNTFGIVAGLVLGIVILTLFFKLVWFIQSKVSRTDFVKVNGLLKDAKSINVHLEDGTILEHVAFVGFIDSGLTKDGRIPYQFVNMVVLETTEQRRILVKADSIKMIEEVERVEGFGARS